LVLLLEVVLGAALMLRRRPGLCLDFETEWASRGGEKKKDRDGLHDGNGERKERGSGG
jgi:hypothetical protein